MTKARARTEAEAGEGLGEEDVVEGRVFVHEAEHHDPGDGAHEARNHK